MPKFEIPELKKDATMKQTTEWEQKSGSAGCCGGTADYC